MKASDLLQEVRFPEFGLERWRATAEKALGGAAFEDVAGLLGVTARRSGQGWLLAP